MSDLSNSLRAAMSQFRSREDLCNYIMGMRFEAADALDRKDAVISALQQGNERLREALRQALGPEGDRIGSIDEDNARLRAALHHIAHTFTEDSHGNTKTMAAAYYQEIALRALEAP